MGDAKVANDGGVFSCCEVSNVETRYNFCRRYRCLHKWGVGARASGGREGGGGGIEVVVDELQPLSRRGSRHIYPVEGDNARPDKRRSESAGRDSERILIADQILRLG